MDLDKLISIQVGKNKDAKSKKSNRNKGKSINELIDNYCLIDLETTGLDPNYDEIIEVSILKVEDNNIISKYQTLIKPEPLYSDDNNSPIYVDNYIERLTGISSAMLEKAPKLNEKIPEILHFIGNDIILGYNVNFDINFMYDAIKNFNGQEFSNDYLDVLKISRRALKDIKHHKLKDIASYFNYEYKAHRALQDCIATFDLYNLLKEYIIKNNINIKPLPKKRYSITDIKSEVIDVNKDNYFYGKNICFTGKLENFIRKDAAQICVNLGAKCQNNITKQTDILVLGNFDYNATVKDNKSTKLKKAEELNLKGQDIDIMSEDVFIDQINY